MAWNPIFQFSVTWDNITGKPLNYPTTWSMVDGKPSTYPSTWGDITGNLANQTDLQNALNAKANDDAVVKTSGAQHDLSGDKTWTGTHTFTAAPIIRGSGNSRRILVFQDAVGAAVGQIRGDGGAGLTLSGEGGFVRLRPNGLDNSVGQLFLSSSGDLTATGNGQFGSTTDSTSDTKLLTVSSNGFAGIFVNGDASNTSGEPGGAFIVLGIDGGSHDSGATKPFFSAINSTGSDGKGGTWAGTSSNSGLIGIPGNYRLQFGTNGQIALYIQGDTASFNNSVSVSGVVSDQDGDVRKVKRRLANANTTIAASDMNGIIEKSNNTAYTYTMPAGMGTGGDILTLVNSGTAQAGTITVNGASGVVFRTGTTSVNSFTIGPSEIVNLYRANTNNRWIKA